MINALSCLKKRRKRLIAFILFFFAFIDKAIGDTCSQAQGEYFRGNLKGAESILLDVLQLNTSRSEAAICWRLLGIVQFSLGKKTHAFNSFEKALAFDEDLSLQSTDTLDPKVVPFFESIKSRRKGTGQPPPPAAVDQGAGSPEVFPPSEPDPLFVPQKQDPIQDLNDPTVFDPAPPSKSQSDDFGSDILRDKERSKKSTKNSKPDPAAKIFSLFPFGIGQFYQKRFAIGAIFAGAEVFTLYRYISITGQIGEEESKLQNFVSENCSAFEASTAGERQRQVCLGYASEQQSYIEGLNSNKNMFLGAFGALVVIGGAEALWYQISSESGLGAKKKRKSRRRSLLFNEMTPHLRIIRLGGLHFHDHRVQGGASRGNDTSQRLLSPQRNLGLALHWTLPLE